MSLNKDGKPLRRCIGCMESKDKDQLVRIGFYEGVLYLDHSKKGKGRGAYLCRDGRCLEQAIKRKSFFRAFKGEVNLEDIEKIKEEIVD